MKYSNTHPADSFKSVADPAEADRSDTEIRHTDFTY